VGGFAIVDEKVARHVGKLIDVVTTLDPWVDHPYRFAAIWMTEGEENVRTAIDLLHRGIEYHPDEWRNWFYLGFDHFYYLGEHEEAADALEQASQLPGSPAYLPRLVARLRSAGADIDVSELFLRQLVDSTDDEEKVAVYQAALDEIEVERKARFLDRAREAYRKLSGRDIERIEDLVTGPYRVVERLPRPHPDALPPAAARHAAWEIDDEGRIFSTFYGTRYEVHIAPRAGEIVDGDASSADTVHGENEVEAAEAPEATGGGVDDV
jgi:tetratricopeptide (TPR) repeat protein